MTEIFQFTGRKELITIFSRCDDFCSLSVRVIKNELDVYEVYRLAAAAGQLQYTLHVYLYCTLLQAML